jgi:DNA-directed RNA polymerase subunit RPC12/RpoP
MKIEAKCETCGRKFLLDQIGPESDAPGRCPFCGARFGRHYTTVLVEAAQESEAATARFVHSLRRLLSMETGFDIDVDKLLKDLTEQVLAGDTQRAAS